MLMLKYPYIRNHTYGLLVFTKKEKNALIYITSDQYAISTKFPNIQCNYITLKHIYTTRYLPQRVLSYLFQERFPVFEKFAEKMCNKKTVLLIAF